jgi:hypothetical protein
MFVFADVSLIADNLIIRHCRIGATTIFNFFSGTEIGPEQDAAGQRAGAPH